MRARKRRSLIFGLTTTLAFISSTNLWAPLAWADVITDGSVGEARTIAGPTFNILAEFGRRAGPNLFHSFEQFGLSQGERAVFSGPTDIANIVSRVTGGTVSEIDGVIQSTVVNADFFLINPAGIVFGPNANLDVQGAFDAGVADFIAFDDGSRYFADPSNGGSFSVGAPTNFGFLGTAANRLRVVDSALAVPPGRSLSLTAGDINIENSALLAPGGTASLTVPQNAIDGVTAESPPPGTITLFEGSIIDVRGDNDGPAGDIRIVGGRVTVDFSRIAAGARTGDGGQIDIQSDALSLQNRGSIDVDSLKSGRGGTIAIAAKSVTLNTGIISARAFDTGDGGAISVNATERIEVDGNGITNRARITTASERNATGKGGDIRLNSPTTALFDRGIIEASARGDGDGGSVHIKSSDLTISGGGIFGNAEKGATGAGGSIQLLADNILLHRTGKISADTFTDKDAGDISIEAKSLTIDGRKEGVNFFGSFFTGIASSTLGGLGDAGALSIQADDVVVRSGGVLSSSTFGPGNAKSIAINATNRVVVGGGPPLTNKKGQIKPTRISSRVFSNASGDAGTVAIDANDVLVTDAGAISVAAEGLGAGGNITVRANSIRIDGIAAQDAPAGFEGTILTGISSSTTNRNGGDAGDITFKADRVDVMSGDVTSSTAGQGNGGAIVIDATGHIRIDGNGDRDRARVQSETAVGSTGAGGLIRLTAPTVEVAERGLLSVAADGSAPGGAIEIAAGTILIDGGGVFSVVGSKGTGNGGALTFAADDMFVRRTGKISADTEGTGDAGAITATVNDLTVDGRFGGELNFFGNFFTGIASSSTKGATGDAGSVAIVADRMTVTTGGVISSSTLAAGDGKSVIIKAHERLTVGVGPLLNPKGDEVLLATIRSRAFPGSTGNAGSVEIDTGALTIGRGGAITAITEAPGRGGKIAITAESIEISGPAASSVDTFFQGDVFAGISSSSALRDRGPEQFVNKTGAAGDAGAVNVQANTIVIDGGGRIRSSTATDGNAGSVTISAQQLDLTNGGRIEGSTQSIGNGGVVTVEADVLTISGKDTADKAGGIFSSTNLGGSGGSIELGGGRILIADSALVNASSNGDGDAGRIDIRADAVRLASGAAITSSSKGTGRGGSISIDAGEQFIADRGTVATSTTQSDGGDITINAGTLLVLDNSAVTTSVAGGDGNGGNIQIDPVFVILFDSRIIANAIRGAGGNILIVATHFLADADSLVQASSKLGIDGSVQIESPEGEVASDLAVLPSELLNAAEQLAQQCGDRGGRALARFVGTGRGALPVGPDRPMSGQVATIAFEEPQLAKAAKSAPVTLLAADQKTLAKFNVATTATPALIRLYCGA